jgi:class 3 adenylate cyclase
MNVRGAPNSRDDHGAAGIQTFLIADIRGYTRFTQDRGDEAATELAAKFAAIARDGVGGHDGRIIELRGDEALAVFRPNI